MNPDTADTAIAELVWFKSSHSGGEGGQCVEVAIASHDVLVRDSKDKAGPSLAFTADEWAAFVEFASQF